MLQLGCISNPFELYNKTKLQFCLSKDFFIDCIWRDEEPCFCTGWLRGELKQGYHNKNYGSVSCAGSRVQSCNMQCLIPRVPDFGDLGGGASVMISGLTHMIFYFLEFLFFYTVCLLMFAFGVVYLVMRYEVLPRRYSGFNSKKHNI